MKIIATEDGSHTIYIPELDETYHSIHGAIQESEHVFIKHGLAYFQSKTDQSAIHILEIGFGTGLNVLLSLIANSVNHIDYTSLEKYPLNSNITSQLNYGKMLTSEKLFEAIHECNWNEEQDIDNRFTLRKIATDFTTYKSKERFDIIYFDAFAPSKQPELWQKELINKCYRLLNDGGILVTYSAKGQLKRDLEAAGFSIESLPGPPGKFEMTRATR